MKDKKPIAEIVSQMSQAEQDKIYKVGNILLIVELIVGIPAIIYIVSGLINMMNMSSDELITFMIISLIIAAIFIGLLVSAVIICPGFSDRKWLYIRKLKKGKIK